MVKVTVDVFSGRQNPSWFLDEKQAQSVLREVSLNRGVSEILSRRTQGIWG
jgi:hypothetical protein